MMGTFFGGGGPCNRVLVFWGNQLTPRLSMRLPCGKLWYGILGLHMVFCQEEGLNIDPQIL